MRGFHAGGPPSHRHHRSDFGVEEEETKGARLPVLRLIGYLKPYKWQALTAFLLSVIIQAAQLAPPMIIGWIVDLAAGKGLLLRLNLMLILLAGAFLLSAILSGVKTFILGRLGQKIIHDLRTDTYNNLQRLSLGYYDNTQTGAIMSRVTNDVNEVERVIVEGTDTFTVAVITLLGIIIILFKLNFKMALAASIPIPILSAITFIIMRRAHRIYRQVRKDLGDMNAILQDNISGIREIKSFTQEDYEERRFAAKSSNYLLSNMKAIRLWSSFFPQIMFFSSIGTVLVLWYGGRSTMIYGTPTPGEIVAFLFYLNLFYMPVRQLNMFNHMLQHARAASERIFEIIDAEPAIADAKDAVNLPEPVKGEVSFKNVYFSYKKGEVVLKDITFTAKQGEKIALVGPTGAGKSTIAGLIPRFYEADSGTIAIDGTDVKKIRLNNLSGNIGIVAQEPFLFNGTIFENIAYGKRSASMEEVTAAAKAANAHQFIAALPNGYENEVGERGIKLSVGEKQRIAIARALLKNPPILILDEATSSVDVHTESLIQEAVERLISSRTAFIIAHRLSTIRKADRILVIDGGRIAEEGTHESLLKEGQIYRNLYKIQWQAHGRKKENQNNSEPGLFT
ncbi:MAG: ABC transporter ATP-binding protein [Candidatus Omnitrophica bacterium]|nr:ABC transporter ATP-binding protein [Candidatus Omnitrophota bacterium]